MTDRPMDDAKLGDDLRGDLTALILLGMADYMVSGEGPHEGPPPLATDEHTIPSHLAAPLVAAAQAALANAEDLIAQTYRENPQTIHSELYAFGYWLLHSIDQATALPEFSLN